MNSLSHPSQCLSEAGQVLSAQHKWFAHFIVPVVLPWGFSWVLGPCAWLCKCCLLVMLSLLLLLARDTLEGGKGAQWCLLHCLPWAIWPSVGASSAKRCALCWEMFYGLQSTHELPALPQLCLLLRSLCSILPWSLTSARTHCVLCNGFESCLLFTGTLGQSPSLCLLIFLIYKMEMMVMILPVPSTSWICAQDEMQ